MPKMPVDATPSASQSQQPPSSTDPSSSQLQESNSVPSSSNKENTFPAHLQTTRRQTAAASSAAAAMSPSTERVPDSQPLSFTNESLPSPLLLLLDSIKSSLRSLFTSKPPHTIQRLAELILYPTVHYRTLPAYLRALDRVVCVTSSAEVFPLQIQASMSQPNGVTNGGGSSGLLFDHAPGSDESLGGALLTPIPWLSNAISFEDEAGEPSNEGTVSHTVIDGPFFNSATKTKANNNRHRIRFYRHTPRDPPGTTTPARTASRTQPRARDNHHHARNNNTTQPPPGHTSHRKRSHGRHHVPSTR